MLRLDDRHLLGALDELAGIGAIEGGGCARLALTDEDRLGRDLVVGWMKELGLDIRIDAIGNVIGLRAGRENLPPVMTGSHIDTVRTGGRYDGNYGVLAGLEVVRALNEARIVTRRPIAVAFFTNEEGARFQPDMMGSLVYAGGVGLNEAYAATDKEGVSVGDELRRIGYLGATKPGALKPHAFLELHIEQGPILDEEKVRIGVVESVQGISWIEYTVTGVSNHAGTTPMRLRRDAGYLAASVNVFARKLAQEIGGNQVATVGALSLRPNLINVVPNRAVFAVDLRNTDEAKLKQAETRVAAHIAEVAKAERVDVDAKVLARFEPVIFDSSLVDRVEHHAKALSLSTRRMPSGAGHDAQMMQRICPTAMIFVPSVAGLSHNVKEHTEAADLAAGAQILANLMLELAEE
ncbi:MAG: M20 family metallo-hydrolase [Reyranella sp.]|uniref:M20 family metallo-hydrolase n=1 Tax=Reyranella sp. TaxID=1929291 RepID=UPI00272FB6D1|nr:M20 family metallo-hydrolase [Reyranella sp.]MDP1964846.1 M20 family metallo-hydrolase [Reyranella sp.]MDP2374067.1 M20 family metallo-hydrolase [Reyranella sp.]